MKSIDGRKVSPNTGFLSLKFLVLITITLVIPVMYQYTAQMAILRRDKRPASEHNTHANRQNWSIPSIAPRPSTRHPNQSPQSPQSLVHFLIYATEGNSSTG
jgi:hypothetical protein